MAPYLKEETPEGQQPNHSPAPAAEAPVYNIPQHLTWNDPQNRKLRVLTIGAGISGILMAYRIRKDCQNVEHVIYEKNRDIGGQTQLLYPIRPRN